MEKKLLKKFDDCAKAVHDGKYEGKLNFTFDWQGLQERVPTEKGQEKALSILQYNSSAVVDCICSKVFRASGKKDKERMKAVMPMFFEERMFDTLNFCLQVIDDGDDDEGKNASEVDLWFDYDLENVVNVNVCCVVNSEERTVPTIQDSLIMRQFVFFVHHPLKSEAARAAKEFESQDNCAPANLYDAPSPLNEEMIGHRLNSALMFEHRRNLEEEIKNKYVQELQEALNSKGIGHQVKLELDWRSIAALPGYDPRGNHPPVWNAMLKAKIPLHAFNHIKELFLGKEFRFWNNKETINWFLERYECDFVVSYEYMHYDPEKVEHQFECSVTERDIEGSDKKGFHYHIRQTFFNLSGSVLVHNGDILSYELMKLIDPTTRKGNKPGIWLWLEWKKRVLDTRDQYVQKITDFFAEGDGDRTFHLEVDWDSIYRELAETNDVLKPPGVRVPVHALGVHYLARIMKPIHEALCGLKDDANAVTDTPESKARFLDEFDKAVIRCNGLTDERLSLDSSVYRDRKNSRVLVIDIKGRWDDDGALVPSADAVGAKINDIFTSEGKGDSRANYYNQKWETARDKEWLRRFNDAAERMEDEATLKDKLKMRFDWSFMEALSSDDKKKRARDLMKHSVRSVVESFLEMMKVVKAKGEERLMMAEKRQNERNAFVLKFFKDYESILFTLIPDDTLTDSSKLEFVVDMDTRDEMRVVFSHDVDSKQSLIYTEDSDITMFKITSFYKRPKVKTGKMIKEGHMVKSWKLRDFVLFADGTLCYYGKGSGQLFTEMVDSIVSGLSNNSSNSSSSQKKTLLTEPRPLGTIDLKNNSKIVEMTKRPYSFSVIEGKRQKPFPMAFADENEKQDWENAIQRVIDAYAEKIED